MKIPILVNAGSGLSEKDGSRLEQIETAFETHHLAVDLQVLQGSELADAAAKEVRAGTPLVVAAGGDGTVSAVAGALAGSKTALGVIPLGTLNHFSKDLGIPQNLQRSIEVISGRETRRVDVGEVNGRVFINNSSIGLYPAMVLERERSRHSKWVAMLVASYRVLRQVPGLVVTLEMEGKTLRRRTPFVFVGNNFYTMHLLSPGNRETLMGGRLQVCAANCSGRSCVLRTAVLALLGRLHQHRHFDALEVSEITVGSRRRHVYVSADGEVLRLSSPLHYRIRPGALRVVVPGGKGDHAAD